ncbi:MAG: hypothetical protein B7Y01_05285, partial [Xanthobacter sp. 17-67-6]
ARLGAIHSVVFGGFSAESLAGRIEDAQSRFLITADEGRRGGKPDVRGDRGRGTGAWVRSCVRARARQCSGECQGGWRPRSRAGFAVRSHPPAGAAASGGRKRWPTSR